jgi:hypothetical protein
MRDLCAKSTIGMGMREAREIGRLPTLRRLLAICRRFP